MQKSAQRISGSRVAFGRFHETCFQAQVGAGLFLFCFVSEFFGVGQKTHLIAFLQPAERCIKHRRRGQGRIGMRDLIKPRGRGVKMFRAILILGRDQVYAVEDDRIGSQCSRFVQYRQRLIKMALLEFQLDKFQKR